MARLRQSTGWLSPWIAESHAAPEMLAEAGVRDTLHRCDDDQPIWHHTAHGITTATGVFDQVAGFLPGIILGDAG